jgi:hypothetical protein
VAEVNDMRTWTWIWKLVIVTAVACGGVGGNPDGAGPGTDAVRPDATRVDGAAPDAMGPPPPDRFGFTAAGRLTGGGWTMDVSVGDPAAQITSTGGTTTCTGASPAL